MTKKKLICAEDLKKEIETWGYGLTYKDCLNEIEKSPAVEAIPIEWIKKYIEDNTHTIADSKYEARSARPVNYFIYPFQINTMLKDWEKHKED